MSDTGDRRNRFAIIGAGPSGLAVARAFKHADVQFDVLERHDGIGGIWDFSNPRTPMYDTAHFISSRTLSAFDGYPMPAHYPDYPSWREILAYVRGFAEAYGLAGHVETETHVTRAAPDEGGGWQVVLATGELRRYAGIVSAVGHDWLPNDTTYPGHFTGESYHSLNYRLPSEFSGKRVLIVGGGNSGCDIASDAATHAERAFISLRRGYHFLPKHLFGKPTDVFFRSGPQPHARIAQPILSLLLRLVVGDLTRYGLKAPDHKPLESHPIVNSQLLHHLAHGNITAKVDVAALAGDQVRFVDGSTEEVDLIVYATGYRREIPFLTETLGTSGTSPGLWAHALVPGHPMLFVAGHFDSDGGAYPLFCKQAELFAALAPNAPARDRLAERIRTAPPDLTGGIRHIDSARHDIHVNTEAYNKFLLRLVREARG